MTAKVLNRWRDIAALNYKRGLVLMGFGAVAGLIMAAIGLFTAKGTSTLLVPPEDVALVNQQPIVRSDFLTQLQTLYDVDYEHATPAQRRKVLDDMIREELFVQRGTELDVASADPATRMAMVSAVEQQAVTDAMTELPSDEKLLAYYNANKSRYSSDGYMTVRDLVFPATAAPDALAAARCCPPTRRSPSLAPRIPARPRPRNSILPPIFIWATAWPRRRKRFRMAVYRSHHHARWHACALHDQECAAGAARFYQGESPDLGRLPP